LNLALRASGLDRAKVIHRPRLLSDNGSSYISSDLAKWLNSQSMQHVRGAPYHPMTQGKIERWHQTLKNRILLENYYLPGDLEAQIAAFVADDNHRRLSREHRQPDARRRPLRAGTDHSDRKGKDQTTDNRQSPLAAPSASRIILQTRGARDSLILSHRLSQKL
jgi:hypothetical protein